MEALGSEVWRGGVNTWECDEMGHLNVRFYVARAMEGVAGLACQLGMPSAFRMGADTTVVVRDQHIRFLREARPGATLHMRGGVLVIGESDARVLLVLAHSFTGEPAASFQFVLGHVTARDLRAFPWTRRTLDRARELTVEVPTAIAPRSLGLEGVGEGASLKAADQLGLACIAAGALGGADCDVFGRMRPEVVLGRISDGIPALRGQLRDTSATAEAPAPRRGGAVLEYRIAHFAWPRAGDQFSVRSGLAAVEARTQRFVHWMLDPVTGRPWATAVAVAAGLDLDNRKIITLTPDELSAAQTRVVAGLSF
jgi:acyl-CoA thioester hydrolase